MKPDGTARVFPVMKAALVLGVLGAVIVIWVLRRDHDPASAQPSAGGRTSSGTVADAKPRPPAHVQRVSPAERQQLADKIRDARSGRAATSAPAGPSLPAAPRPSLPPSPGLTADNPEQFKTTMRAAMKEVIPYLAECYDKHGTGVPDEISVVAKLSLTGDPDVGTLIDTRGLADDEDAALPAEFDLCLRDSLAGLQLPPLTEGEEVQVTYPFLFTR